MKDFTAGMETFAPGVRLSRQLEDPGVEILPDEKQWFNASHRRYRLR